MGKVKNIETRQTDDTVPLIHDLSVAEDVRKVKNYRGATN